MEGDLLDYPCKGGPGSNNCDKSPGWSISKT